MQEVVPVKKDKINNGSKLIKQKDSNLQDDEQHTEKINNFISELTNNISPDSLQDASMLDDQHQQVLDSFITEQALQSKMKDELHCSVQDEFEKKLLDFDVTHETLLDYFTIIGFDNGQLRILISELLEQNQLERSSYMKGFFAQYVEEMENQSQQQLDQQSDSGSSSYAVTKSKNFRGLNRIINSSIIERFPPVDRLEIKFPPHIEEFFFEVRERVYTQSDKVEFEEQMRDMDRNPDRLHQVEVCTGANGEVIYLTAHMFFEDLRDLQDAMPTRDLFEDLNLKDGTLKREETTSISNESQQCLSKDEEGKNESSRDSLQKTTEDLEFTTTDEFLQLRFTGATNKRKINNVEDPEYAGKLKRGLFFVKKGFCLVSHRVPGSKNLNEINIFLKEAIRKRQLFARFEDYISQLLFTIPMPSRRFKSQMNVYLPSTDPQKENAKDTVVSICQPGPCELPYVDYQTISCLFNCLSEGNILRIFRRILLDTSNLMQSADPTKLVNCCEAFKALIFPFKFEFVYTPHLPQGIQDRTDLPITYLLGIEEKNAKKAEANIKDGTYIVDLDRDRVWQQPHTSNNMTRGGSSKDTQLDDLPDLPDLLQEKLERGLQRIKSGGKGKNFLSERQVMKVRNLFFEFFVELLQNFYKQGKEFSDQKTCGLNPRTIRDPSCLFNSKKFLESYHFNEPQNSYFVFLRALVVMPLFQRLILRDAVQDETNLELQVFEQAIKMRSKLQYKDGDFTMEKFESKIPMQSTLEFPVLPIFELYLDSRRSESHNPPKRRLSDEFHRVKKKDDGGFEVIETCPQRQKYTVQLFIYHSTPQFLDLNRMMLDFNLSLYQGEHIQQITDQLAAVIKSRQKLVVQDSLVHLRQLANFPSDSITNNNSNYRMWKLEAKKTKRDQIQFRYDLKDQATNVYICWILTWCASLGYQHSKERLYVTLQASQVVKKLFYRVDPDVQELVKLMMHSVFLEGTETMVRIIYALYNEDLRLPIDNWIQHHMTVAIGRGDTPQKLEQQVHFDVLQPTNQAQRVTSDMRKSRIQHHLKKQNLKRDEGRKNENNLEKLQKLIDEKDSKQIDENNGPQLNSGNASSRSKSKNLANDTEFRRIRTQPLRNSKEQRDEKERFILDEIKAENIYKEYVNQARHRTQYTVGTTTALQFENEIAVHKAATFVEDLNRRRNQQSQWRKVKNVFKKLIKKDESKQDDQVTESIDPTIIQERSTKNRLQRMQSAMPDLFSISNSLDFQNLIKEQDVSFLTRNSSHQQQQAIGDQKQFADENRVERVTRKLGIVEEIKGLEDCSLSYQAHEKSNMSVSQNESRFGLDDKADAAFVNMMDDEILDGNSNPESPRRTRQLPMSISAIKDNSASYYEDYFVNRGSKEYQELRSKQRLRQRTFLLPEDQKKADKDDKVRIVVNHTCEHCGKLLDCDMIHTRARRFETKNPKTGLEQVNYAWECENCRQLITPKLKVWVGDTRQNSVQEVLLFHPVQLRKLLEIHFDIDFSYEQVQQDNMDDLRQNPKIFWNLIYYFKKISLPFEFMVPYADQELLKDLTREISVKSKHTVLKEFILQHGTDWLFVKRPRRSSTKAKKSDIKSNGAQKSSSFVQPNTEPKNVKISASGSSLENKVDTERVEQQHDNTSPGKEENKIDHVDLEESQQFNFDQTLTLRAEKEPLKKLKKKHKKKLKRRQSL